MQGFLTLVFGIFIGAGSIWLITPNQSTALCSPNQGGQVKFKLSVNGICHSEDSQYFNYIKHFTSYDSLSECITDGGRFPVER